VVAPGVGAHAAAKPAIVTNDCETINVNDDGWDYQNNGAYGNRGYIYINSSGVIDNLHDAIFRNFFVTGDEDNNVEAGWTADNGGYSGPTVYSEWMIDDVQYDPVFYTGYSLSPGTNKVFNIENVGDVGIFRFYVDDQANPYGYSPEMKFQNGYIQTNTERYNSCDSMYANFTSLNWYDFNAWTSSYNDLECYITTAGGYYFDKASNSAHSINTSNGVTCPP
jgi:hypothetical protein